ncbi:hypothetical protein EDC04DRAFT_2604842 [Pisolithus marmoratus]|nr:hypothetical protein EDC04DRAFT_2604842 [Pisolithus marmoratus]
MPLSDKGQPMYDKENHNETLGGQIHWPSEKWWQLVGDQHEATQHCEARAHKEHACECLQELFSSHSVPTKLSSRTRQPLAFHNNKVPRTPCISANAIEALKALMASDGDGDDEYCTITSHGSQVHGKLKTKLCPLVKVVFGFHSSQSKSIIKKNHLLAEALKEGTNFAFKHMVPMEEDHHSPTHTGTCTHSKIECCIDKWATGKQGDIPFTTQEYHLVYEAYLKCLQDFDVATKEVSVLLAICTRIYEASHIHSGASAITVESQCKVSACIIAAAIQAHQEGSTMEDDSKSD